MAFVKGQSGNPNGRPKKTAVHELEKAIRKVQRTNKKKLLVHAVEQAFKDNSVLVAILKKILPDLRHVEGTIKAEVDVIAMTVQEKMGYEELAKKIAQGEIQKQLTEGDGE